MGCVLDGHRLWPRLYDGDVVTQKSNGEVV